jgi:hypothetical protein
MNYFIYAIKNDSTNNVYIGSTERTFAKRFQSHLSQYKLWLKNAAGYCYSYEIIKCSTAYIEYIEACDKKNRNDREQYWIDNTPNCINKKNTSNEAVKKRRLLNCAKYYEQNKDKIREKQKEYYNNNR